MRQELILKGTSAKKNMLSDSEDFDDNDLNSEEKAALKMLSPEKRKLLGELESAGANKQYIKKKIKQCLI